MEYFSTSQGWSSATNNSDLNSIQFSKLNFHIFFYLEDDYGYFLLTFSFQINASNYSSRATLDSGNSKNLFELFFCNPQTDSHKQK